MRDTVRDLLHLVTDVQAVGQISLPPSNLALAALSPDGPMQDYTPVPIEEPIPKATALKAVETAKEENEPSVSSKEIEREQSTQLVELMRDHSSMLNDLQSEIRRLDVARAKAQTECEQLSTNCRKLEEHLRLIQNEIDDERKSSKISEARANLLEQATTLPWWRVIQRRDLMRRARALVRALPAA
ncbi:MAG: hypothetical protein CMH54_00780 [Myxococcales bacterium]|nr:hypothetical protein [Myxococcales bacterium]